LERIWPFAELFCGSYPAIAAAQGFAQHISYDFV